MSEIERAAVERDTSWQPTDIDYELLDGLRDTIRAFASIVCTADDPIAVRDPSVDCGEETLPQLNPDP